MEKLTTKNCIIACQDGRIYSSPAHIPHIASCNISSPIDVGVNGMSTIPTFLEASMSGSISPMTPITFLGSISGINIDYSTTFFESLIFNKALKLVECPLVYPFIILSRLSNSTQIFHNNNIPLIQTGYNRSTYVVISPTHKPRPFARELFQFSLGTSGAFALEFTDKFVSPYPQGFNFVTIKDVVGCDSEIINPQVHSENFVMLVRSHRSFLGECKSKIMFSSRLSKQTFNNIPVIKVFQSIFRNLKGNLNPTVNRRNTQSIVFKGETPRSIIPNRNFINDRSPAFTFQYTTSHLDTRSRKLSRKSDFSKLGIDVGMEFDIVINSENSPVLNAILKTLFVEVDSIDYDFINFNFNRNTSNQHKEVSYFNYINVLENSAIPPCLERQGLLASNINI